MADLKTPFNEPAMAAPDLGGDLATARGMDPNINDAGSSGVQAVWSDPFVSLTSGMETANPVSGLPLEPARYQPTETPPAPPDLTDRNPGTIDQK